MTLRTIWTRWVLRGVVSGTVLTAVSIVVGVYSSGQSHEVREWLTGDEAKLIGAEDLLDPRQYTPRSVHTSTSIAFRFVRLLGYRSPSTAGHVKHRMYYVGAPFLALRGDHRSSVNAGAGSESTVNIAMSGKYMIPYGVLPLGMVGNVTFWGAVSLVPWIMFGALRRSYRWRRGRCVQCGYQVSERMKGCPECGSQLN